MAEIKQMVECSRRGEFVQKTARGFWGEGDNLYKTEL